MKLETSQSFHEAMAKSKTHIRRPTKGKRKIPKRRSGFSSVTALLDDLVQARGRKSRSSHHQNQADLEDRSIVDYL